MFIELLFSFFHPFVESVKSCVIVFFSVLPAVKMLSIEFWVCFGLGVPVFVLSIVNYCFKEVSKNKKWYIFFVPLYKGESYEYILC